MLSKLVCEVKQDKPTERKSQRAGTRIRDHSFSYSLTPKHKIESYNIYTVNQVWKFIIQELKSCQSEFSKKKKITSYQATLHLRKLLDPQKKENIIETAQQGTQPSTI